MWGIVIDGNIRDYTGGGYRRHSFDASHNVPKINLGYKRLLVLFLSLCIVLSLSHASTLRWSWAGADDKVQCYRWQLNSEEDGGWKVEDSSTTSIILDRVTSSDTLFVQASYDGSTWSESGTGTYIKESVSIPLSLRLNVTPYSSAVYYFYNGHYIDNARTLMGTIYGVSATLELDYTPLSFMRLYPEAGYSYEMKIQTVIPKKQDMHYVKIGGGVDFLLSVTQRTDIYLGFYGGAMWHINNSKYSTAPYFGSRLGLDVSLNEHFTLGAFTRVSASFLNTNDTLTNSVTLIIDSLTLSGAYVF